jgi:Na+-transporting NADH:ubiquinone oxidoreductase subunit C
VRDADGTPHFDFVRGTVNADDPEAEHKIDGIAGATITTRGVTDMILFWMGEDGFQPLLERLGNARVAHGSSGAGRAHELVNGMEMAGIQLAGITP